MNPYSIPTLTIGLVLLALGAICFQENKNTFKLFGLVSFLAAGWQLSWTILFNISKIDVADYVGVVGYAFIVFVPFYLCRLTYALINKKPRFDCYYKHITLGFFLLNLIPRLLTNGVEKHFFGFYPKAGPLHPFFVLFVSFALVVTIFDFIKIKNHRSQKMRANLAISALVVFSFSSFDFLTNYGYDLYPVGIYFTFGYLLMILYLILVEQKNKISAFNKKLQGEIEKIKKEIILKNKVANESQKLATIGMVAAGVAHQLGNTLNTISIANLSLQGQSKKLPEKNHKINNAIRRIDEAIEASEKIIHGLDYTSKENIETGDVQISNLIDSSIALIAGKAFEKIAIENRVSRDIIIMADKNSLLQVFINLLSNSIDALAKSVSPTIIIESKIIESTLHLYVKDNGPGIAPELSQTLYEPFVTTRPPELGTGLGLYIVKKEVEKSGATILQNNLREGGCCFTITFPQVFSEKAG